MNQVLTLCWINKSDFAVVVPNSSYPQDLSAKLINLGGKLSIEPNHKIYTFPNVIGKEQEIIKLLDENVLFYYNRLHRIILNNYSDDEFSDKVLVRGDRKS